MSSLHYQVKKHNDALRHVRELPSLRLTQFLGQCGEGNMLVLGGTRDDRRAAVLALTEDIRRDRRRPVILFTGDPLISRALMESAGQGRVGRLCLIDRQHPHYDFFAGMNAYFIAEYFVRLALLRGVRDTAKLLTYTGALLAVLADRASLTLENLCTFLQNTDDEIVSVCDPSRAQILRGAPDGGVLLRGLAETAREALGFLTTQGMATGFSLHSAVAGNALVCVTCPDELHDVRAEYFAAELRSLLGQRFTVILDDDLMAANADMKACLDVLRQDVHAELILAYGNMTALHGSVTEWLSGFPRQMLFLHGDLPATDLREVLSSYGQYSEMQAVANESTPPSVFCTPLLGKGLAPVVYSIDRVPLQRLRRFDALLLASAFSDELLLTKDLII